MDKLSTEILGDDAEWNKHIQKAVVKRAHKLVDFRVLFARAVRELQLYVFCRGDAVSALPRFPLSGIDVFFGVGLSDLFRKVDKKVPPFVRAFLHVDSRKKLSSKVVVWTAPAAYAVVAKTIGFVEIGFLRQEIEPYIDVLPVKDGTCDGLFLDFYGFGVLGDATVFGTAHGFVLANAVKRENLSISEFAVQDSRDGSRLEHGTAPSHHSGGRSYLPAHFVEILVAILGGAKFRKRVSFLVAFRVFKRGGKFKGCVSKDVRDVWIP